MSKGLGSQKHIHRYHRLKDGLWYCSLNGCTHYMPKNMINSVTGRKSICWQCGNVMILTEESMKKDEPVCVACSPQGQTILEFLKSKGL